MVLGAVAAFAEPSVAITKVKLSDARDGTVEYGYTVSGDFGGKNWDLFVKVSSDDGTKSVVLTNVDVMAGAVTKTVNVKALLGKAYPGVSFFAELKEGLPGVQLWAGGPHFAECNVGATKPEGYGILTNFNDAAKAVTAAMGDGWRLPTYEEFEALLNNCNPDWIVQNGVNGRRFSGKGDYSSRSIFLPAAGYESGFGYEGGGVNGEYWSSFEVYDLYASYLFFSSSYIHMSSGACSLKKSVRAVQ